MIFVFGSNKAGIHGAGAARYAHQHLGAAWGFGEGLTGKTYALPTKGWDIEVISLDEIHDAVNRFIKFATIHKTGQFQVTRVGCGLGGQTDENIAPMFKDAPDNCLFDDVWKPYLGEGHRYWGTF